jgi:RNA polymerase sigma-70 factor (ECF subfamily)
MDDSSRVLVTQAQSGSLPAVEELLERHLPGLRAYIRLRAGPAVRARESASDLAQSVCREVLEHLDRFQYGGEAGFKHWLYATALRLIQNRHKHWNREKRDVGREVPMAGGGSASELQLAYHSVSSPSQKVMGQEQLDHIEAAFDELSEPDREIITLARIVGLSHKEIAEAQGKSEGACRVSLNRALTRLATHLDGPRDPGGAS